MARAFFKTIAAGVLAFTILNVLCLWYYNTPRHLTSDTKVTDYRWEYKYQYSKATEGFGSGQVNNEGYMNQFDYENQKISHLILGSSHMEGTNVAMKDSVSSRLNVLLPGELTYNLGVSGHNLYTVASNLPMALKHYQPDGSVMIEISSVQFEEKNLKEVNQGVFPEIQSYDKGIVFALQKLPYLRLLYSQIKSVTANTAEIDDLVETKSSDLLLNQDSYKAELNQVLSNIKSNCNTTGAQPIIFYHPILKLIENGSVAPKTDPLYHKIFKQSCEDNGIIFLDMTDRFLQEYKNFHILPNGFSNTEVGQAHLNREGHRMIAEELVKVKKQS